MTGEDGPALALITDHAAEHVSQRRGDREDRDHLQEIRQGSRVLERMCGIGVKKTATVGAEHLDRDLRGDRPDRDGLFRAFERCRVDVGAERLGHALPDQDQRKRYADRNEEVERATGDIDPEITDAARGVPRETADERN